MQNSNQKLDRQFNKQKYEKNLKYESKAQFTKLASNI